MVHVFTEVLNISIVAGYLILAVLAVRTLFPKIPKSFICFLWILVAIRLIFPQIPESRFSLIPSTQVFTTSEVYANLPVIETGYENLDVAANTYLQEEFNAYSNAYSMSNYQKMFLWGTVLWILGMTGFGAYLCVSWLRLKYRVQTAVPDSVENQKIYRCEEIAEPFLFGIVKPKIYIPWEFSEEELKSVILHECAHMKRGDHILKPVFYMILMIHWFNPLVWLAYILLCRDIEFACDESVVKRLGEEGKTEYSSALLACSSRKTLTMGCPVAFGKGSIKSRVQRILSYKKPGIIIMVLGMVISVFLAICFMTGQKESKKDNSIVYKEYDISMREAVACEETGMIRMEIQITSDSASQEELERFGNELEMGVTGFSHVSSGFVTDTGYVKQFSGDFLGDVDSVLQVGTIGEDFSWEIIGSFSKDIVRWEEAKRFETDSSMGKMIFTISPSTLQVQCLEGKIEKHVTYVFKLHMASGETWMAGIVPLGSKEEVNVNFDRTLYSVFGSADVTDDTKNGKADENMGWKFIFKESLEPEQIVSVSVEEVFKNKK